MKAFGNILQGKLILKNQRSFKDGLVEFEGKEVEIRIKERSNKRSKEQNSLYWQWINILRQETGFQKNEMHELIKYKFLQRNVVNDDGVEEVILKSTTTLTVKEFNQLMNEVLFWSNDTLGIKLPSNE